jgi:uncharacterized pyridoxal phosphate-containing UPF0001 family protein
MFLPEISNLSKVKIVGLMTMAPIDASETELIEIFDKAKSLQVEIASQKFSSYPVHRIINGDESGLSAGDFARCNFC